MKPALLEIQVSLKILKSIHDVFEAIVDPEKMSDYFISKGSGIMEKGKKIIWQFPEMDMGFPIHVSKIEKDKYISFCWNDYMDNTETLVEITLMPKDENFTLVTITEKSRVNDEAGIRWLKANTEGWTNFLSCLKAYLEYRINLRKGAFDKSQMPEKDSNS